MKAREVRAERMASVRCAEQCIRHVISRSRVPEDPVHAEGTLAWVIQLKPDADEVLKLAAIGHDIERSIESRRVAKHLFKSFDEYKMAHAINSAQILRGILEECGLEKGLTNSICRLVRLHEIGGDEASDILKNADSLSYFRDNLPLYFARNGRAETQKRAMWGFARLSPELRHVVANLVFDSEEIDSLLREVVIAGIETHRT